MKTEKVMLALLLLYGIYRTAVGLKPLDLDDFNVYQTAAVMVRDHHSDILYEGADTGKDPQLTKAKPTGVFQGEAHRIGLAKVQMYVYPPTLADMLLPLTYLSIRNASRVWILLNIMVVAVFFVLARQMVHSPWKSLGTLAIALGILTYYPIFYCLELGGVLIILLLLWSCGVFAYLRGWMVASAIALALATAIKLTPLIIVIPMIVFKEWRWLRVYALTLFALLVTLLCCNGPASLLVYFGRVMPAMSRGMPSPGNWSVLAAFQQSYVALAGGNPKLFYEIHAPTWVLVAGKVMATCCVGLAAGLLWKNFTEANRKTRAFVLVLFAMLSAPLSPVSWIYAFVPSLLGLVFLWAEGLRRKLSPLYLALLFVTSLECNWFVITQKIRTYSGNVGFGLVSFLPALLTLSLVLYRLGAVKEFRGMYAVTGSQ